MTRPTVLASAICAILFLIAATSATAAWKPGTPIYLSENQAVRTLETTVDFAWCDGIRRFGHRGITPERFLVFDCSVKMNGTYCADARLKALRDTRRGTFRFRLIRRCHV